MRGFLILFLVLSIAIASCAPTAPPAQQPQQQEQGCWNSPQDTTQCLTRWMANVGMLIGLSMVANTMYQKAEDLERLNQGQVAPIPSPSPTPTWRE